MIYSPFKRSISTWHVLVRREVRRSTRSQPNFKHGHEVTAEFWRSQIVTLVTDLTTVGIGETTPHDPLSFMVENFHGAISSCLISLHTNTSMPEYT